MIGVRLVPDPVLSPPNPEPRLPPETPLAGVTVPVLGVFIPLPMIELLVVRGMEELPIPEAEGVAVPTAAGVVAPTEETIPDGAVEVTEGEVDKGVFTVPSPGVATTVELIEGVVIGVVTTGEGAALPELVLPLVGLAEEPTGG